MICLLFAAVLSLCALFFPDQKEQCGTRNMPDSRQSVQSAVWTVPAALETIPVALQDAALCRKSVRLSGIVSECRQYEDGIEVKTYRHIRHGDRSSSAREFL
jgi:hypothetical protein